MTHHMFTRREWNRIVPEPSGEILTARDHNGVVIVQSESSERWGETDVQDDRQAALAAGEHDVTWHVLIDQDGLVYLGRDRRRPAFDDGDPGFVIRLVGPRTPAARAAWTRVLDAADSWLEGVLEIVNPPEWECEPMGDTPVWVAPENVTRRFKQRAATPRDDAIRVLQESLNRHGYSVPGNGVNDYRTQEMLERLRFDYGSDNANLHSPQVRRTWPVWTQGGSGKTLPALNERVYDRGGPFLPEPIYTSRHVMEVSRFQEREGLPRSGRLTPETQRRLWLAPIPDKGPPW